MPLVQHIKALYATRQLLETFYDSMSREIWRYSLLKYTVHELYVVFPGSCTTEIMATLYYSQANKNKISATVQWNSTGQSLKPIKQGLQRKATVAQGIVTTKSERKPEDLKTLCQMSEHFIKINKLKKRILTLYRDPNFSHDFRPPAQSTNNTKDVKIATRLTT